MCVSSFFLSIAVFYNTLAHHRNELVRLYVSSPNVQVTDAEKNVVASQSNLVWTDNVQTASTKFEVRVGNTHVSREVNPIQWVYFHIARRKNTKHCMKTKSETKHKLSVGLFMK